MNAFLQQQEGATTPSIARDFLDVGGRLMISPSGALEVSGGLRWALASTTAREARKSFGIERRMCRRMRQPGFTKKVLDAVQRDGAPTATGWLVLGGTA